MFDSLWPHGLQHARFPCPLLSLGVCSNSCLFSWWCHPTISSFVARFSSFPHHSIRVFSNESALRLRWPKYWSFSISEYSSEYSGLISFGIDWFDLLAVQGRLRSLFRSTGWKHPFFQAQPSYGPTLKFVQNYWINNSFDYNGTWLAKWCLCFLICCLGLS